MYLKSLEQWSVQTISVSSRICWDGIWPNNGKTYVIWTYKVICNMRNQDLIAQQAFSSLQLGRISFSAVLVRPAVAAFPSCAPETGHTVSGHVGVTWGRPPWPGAQHPPRTNPQVVCGGCSQKAQCHGGADSCCEREGKVLMQEESSARGMQMGTIPPAVEKKCSLLRSACKGVNQTSLVATLHIYLVFK